MRRGLSPTEAAEDALKRILKKYSSFTGAVIGVSINGSIGKLCNPLVKCAVTLEFTHRSSYAHIFDLKPKHTYFPLQHLTLAPATSTLLLQREGRRRWNRVKSWSRKYVC